VATHAGRTLAVRALARLAPAEVDAALGRATRDLLATRPAAAAPAVAVLAERALADAHERLDGVRSGPRQADTRSEAVFARGVGAAAALARLDAEPQAWSQQERARIEAALTAVARSSAAREATPSLPAPVPEAPPETAP
jgi:hypothetical protein